jgi:hypothetical protein
MALVVSSEATSWASETACASHGVRVARQHSVIARSTARRASAGLHGPGGPDRPAVYGGSAMGVVLCFSHISSLPGW